jgi:hypothetical protein
MDGEQAVGVALLDRQKHGSVLDGKSGLTKLCSAAAEASRLENTLS